MIDVSATLITLAADTLVVRDDYVSTLETTTASAVASETLVQHLVTESPGVPVYDTRTDISLFSPTYWAEAVPGSVDSDPVWRIQRTTINTDLTVVKAWAGGSPSFSYRWTERTLQEYV